MAIAQRIAKNTLFIFSSGIIAKAISVVFLVYAVRILGPSEFGIYALIMTVIFFLSFFIDFGIAPMAIRELARDREKVKNLFNHIMTLRVSLAVLLYPILILAVNLLGYEERIKILIYIMAAAFLLNAFSGSFRILYYSMERMQTPSVIQVLVSLLSSSAGILILYLGYGLTGLVLVTLTVNALGALISGIWVRHYILKYRFSFNREIWSDLLKQAFPFGIIGFLNRINKHMSIIFLSKLPGPYTPDIAIGFYSPAQKVATSLLPIVRSLRVASLPTIAGNIDKKRLIQTILEKTTQFSLLTVSIPLLIGALFFSYDLITFVFGDVYSESSSAFEILGIAFSIQAFNAPVISTLSATRDIYKFIPWITASIAINITFCLILIPIMSFKGAAISILIGNLFRTVAVQRLLKKTLNMRIFSIRRYIKGFVILLFISIFCLLLNTLNLHFVYRIITALIIYIACLLIFFRSEIKWFKNYTKDSHEYNDN